MKRALLIYPSQFYCADAETYPIVVRSQLVKLYSHLRHRGVGEIGIIDLELELGRPVTDGEVADFLDSARALIGGRPWDLIGISCYTSVSFRATLAVASLARELHPAAVIAVGGYHCLASPDDFESCTAIDHIVRGDGLPFLDALLAGESLPRVSFYRGAAPDPPAMLYDEYPYRFRRLPPVAHVQLSRGCPFTCHFCSEPFTGNSRFVPLPVDEAIARIDGLIRDHSPDKVIIEDLIFGFHAGWRHEFLEALRDRRYRQIFWAEMRADTIVPRTAELLSRSNFDVTIGLESASEQTLQTMGKSTDPVRYIRAFGDAARIVQMHRVPTTFTIMLNFPGDTLETFDETMTRIEDTFEGVEHPQFRFDFLEYSFYPGNRTYADIDVLRERFGTEIRDRQWYFRRDGRMLEMSLAATPSARLAGQVGREAIHEYYRPRVGRVQERFRARGDLRSRLFWSYRFVRSLQRRWRADDGEDYFSRDLAPDVRRRAVSMATMADAHRALAGGLCEAMGTALRPTWPLRMGAWYAALDIVSERFEGPDSLDDPARVAAAAADLLSSWDDPPRLSAMLSSLAAPGRGRAWTGWI